MNDVVLHTAQGSRTVSAAKCLEMIEILSSNPNRPFEAEIKECLASLSKSLLASPFGRDAPQLLALGFWLRPAAIDSIERHYKVGTELQYRVARGMAYQLPPSNVDTLFAYSWALSFLVGNTNITRLPTILNPISQWLLDQILTCVRKHNQDEKQIFCSFDKSITLGSKISQYADVRLIWGGDAKIRDISQSTTRPDGLTLGFSDRKSICLINTKAYAELNEIERLQLAEKFYNDTYWFDQMGCGSPRLLGWIGVEKPDSESFFKAIQSAVQSKNHKTITSTDVSKFVYANEMLGGKYANSARRYSADLLVLDAEPDSHLLDNIHGGGSLWQIQLPELKDVEALVRKDLQTITTFGFDNTEKQALAMQLNGRGGFRIVPIGEALNFDSVWDGIDLVRHLTRLITIK